MEFIVDRPVAKSTGFYRCIDDITNFKIRVKINEIKQKSKNDGNENSIERVFLWQEKRFSRTQRRYYADKRNCLTEQEKEFNQLVCDNNSDNGDDDGCLFSYIDSEEFFEENEAPSGENVNCLESISSQDSSIVGDSHGEYDFNRSLQKTIERPLPKQNYTRMHLLADLGEYFEGAWIKNEKLLCTLKYNAGTKVLQVSPDFTSNTYSLRVPRPIQNDEKLFGYLIENCSEDIPESVGLNEKTLIREMNLHRDTLKRQMLPENFEVPPRNRLNVFLFLEISWGARFEYPEVFVQYFIDLPEGWDCQNEENLRGRTQTCRANEDALVYFGHCAEALLEYNYLNLKSDGLPKRPYVYFEIFSRDSWDRFRTEGLCHMTLPISQSGPFEYVLNGFRVTTESPLGEMKRRFIGDCQNYSDVTWLGVPKGGSVNYLSKCGTETVPTGQLKVRLNVVHQSREFIDERPDGGPDRARRTISEKLGSSSLIKGVEQVIQEFKRARKEMLEARRNIEK